MARMNAKRFSKAEWDQHREFVRQRYLIDHMTLEQVHRELATQMDFSVSLNQLEYRCKKIWKFSKYLDETTWQEIGALRASDGDPEGRQFFSRGRHLSARKVNKEIKRRHLHQQGTSQTSVAQIAAAPSQPATGAEMVTTCLVSCPGTFDSPNLKDLLSNTKGQCRLAVFSSLGPSERAGLLLKIVNKLFDQDWHRALNEILVSIIGIIEFIKFATCTLGSDFLHTKTDVFQATLLRLWKLLVKSVHGPVHINKKYDDDTDHQLHRVLEWLLSAIADYSLLTPSISEAFAAMLTPGNIKVALLLWPLREIESTSHLDTSQETFTFRQLVSVRTEESARLVRDMLRTGPVELILRIVRSSAQYSRTDDFKHIFASVAASFTSNGHNDSSSFWSSSFIRQVLTDCVKGQAEESAAEKLNFVSKELEKLGLQLLPSHVDLDTFKYAARQGSLHLLKDLRAINPNLALKDRSGFSTLQVAADFGHLELCEWIFENTPEARQDADSIILSFFVALAQGHFEICHFFEERLLAIHRRQFSVAEWNALLCSCNHPATSRGTSPPFKVGGVVLSTSSSSGCVLCNQAWHAAWKGCESQLQFHLDHGARVSLYPTLAGTRLRDSDRPSPCGNITTSSSLANAPYVTLTAGSLPARRSCTELLLSSGIRPTRENLATSLAAGEWSMTQLLLQHGALLEMPGRLLEAAICGQNKQSIIEVHQTMDGVYDPSALCTAVAFSSDSGLVRDIALGLASRRVNSDLGSQVESTAIALAAIQGDMELFTRLLDVIPSPHHFASDACVYTSCHNPVAPEAFRDTIRMSFLKEHRKPLYRGRQRFPLLGVIATCNRPDVARALLRQGLQPDLEACSKAIVFGSLATLGIFLHGQPPLREWIQPKKDNHDPLRAAILHGNHSKPDFSLISLLLSAGANVNFGRSSTHLMEAVRLGNLQLVKFLLDQGADVNAICKSGLKPTALHWAISKSAEMVELLIARGADINPQHEFNYLSLASERYDMLEIFISNKVKIDGHHRLDYINAVYGARVDCHTLIERRLQQYGDWQQEDEDIVEIMDSLKRHGKALSKKNIMDGIARELAGRKQGEAIGADKSGTPNDTTVPEIPENSGGSPIDHLTTMSPWQHFQISFGSMGSVHPFYDASFGYVDIPSPPCCPDEFDGWLGVSGPRFLRQDVEEIERELDEEMPKFFW